MEVVVIPADHSVLFPLLGGGFLKLLNQFLGNELVIVVAEAIPPLFAHLKSFSVRVVGGVVFFEGFRCRYPRRKGKVSVLIPDSIVHKLVKVFLLALDHDTIVSPIRHISLFLWLHYTISNICAKKVLKCVPLLDIIVPGFAI